MLEIFALIVLAVLVGVGIWLIVLIGNIPGNMARAANHPYADAISLLAWIGLLTMGLGWFAALVWAKVQPQAADENLERRIAELEARVQQMEVNS